MECCRSPVTLNPRRRGGAIARMCRCRTLGLVGHPCDPWALTTEMTALQRTAGALLWRPVEEFCAGKERVRFFHLEDWPGFKSGALNFGLEQVDPARRSSG